MRHAVFFFLTVVAVVASLRRDFDELGVLAGHPRHVVMVIRPIDGNGHVLVGVHPRLALRGHHDLVSQPKGHGGYINQQPWGFAEIT